MTVLAGKTLRLFVWWLVIFAALGGALPAAVFADDPPPVELSYYAAVESFKVIANGRDIAVPVGRALRQDYTFAGNNANTLGAELRVRARGQQELRAQITFDGRDAADVAVTREGDVHIFRALRSVPPFRRVVVGYFVEVKPRIATVGERTSVIDGDGGLDVYNSGKVIAAFQDRVASGALRNTDCAEAIRAYFVGRPVQRFARWTAAQVALNLLDLGMAYFGGAFISEAIERAVESRWVINTWRNWVAKKLAEILAGTAYNFAKDIIGGLIQNGQFMLSEVPGSAFKSFVNGCFGTIIDGLGDWQGTMPKFIASKVADVETEAAFAAWRHAAGGEGPPPVSPEGEAVVDSLREGLTDAESELRRRGLTADYLRFMSDDANVTVRGQEYRIRVLGAQWLVNGEGSLLILCDRVPKDPNHRCGFIVTFRAGRNGVMNIPDGSAGIRPFTPVEGESHDAEALARELTAAQGGR